MNDSSSNLNTAATDPTEWVDRHGDALFRFALLRLGDRHSAEDVVQETFVAALRTGRFAGKADERTWFIGILKHKIADHYRRTKREPTGRANSDERQSSERQSSERLSDDSFDERGWWRKNTPADWPSSDGDPFSASDFWETLRHCLDGLPERLRVAFALRTLDDTPTSQLCDLLQVTPGNLNVMLYRARFALRRCLEVNWFSDDRNEA